MQVARATVLLVLAGGLVLAACASAPDSSSLEAGGSTPSVGADVMEPTVRYTLVTGGGSGKMVYVGRGGVIDGQEDPTLTAQVGDVVELTLVSGDYLPHDLAIDEFGVVTPQLQTIDDSLTATFLADQAGDFAYYCTLAGHRQAGMEGILHVSSVP